VSLLKTKNRPDIGELQAWILGHPGTISAYPPSRINFSRLFRGETGETPAQFTERARAALARCKLEHTVVPVETIAEGVRLR
jgi:hypothetical protein